MQKQRQALLNVGVVMRVAQKSGDSLTDAGQRATKSARHHSIDATMPVSQTVRFAGKGIACQRLAVKRKIVGGRTAGSGGPVPLDTHPRQPKLLAEGAAGLLQVLRGHRLV